MPSQTEETNINIEQIKSLLLSNFGFSKSQFAKADIAVGLLQNSNFDITCQLAAFFYVLSKTSKHELSQVSSLVTNDVAEILKATEMIKPVAEKITAIEKLKEQLRHLMVAASIDFRVIFVQLAYWYSELNFLNSLSKIEADELCDNCLNIYAPIAHRFGMYVVKNSLENISFSHANPHDFKVISDFLSQFKIKHAASIDDLSAKIEAILSQDSIKHKLTFRTKGIYSTFKKAALKNVDFRELQDLLAARIVVDDTASCYTVLGRLHNQFTPIEGRFKDYISRPKSNGYKSLHTTIIDNLGTVFEIQIRTSEMHRHAEYGIASHWSYKEKSKDSAAEREQLTWLRTMVDAFIANSNSGEGYDNLKSELYQNAIFVFTPQGRMIKLPKNSSIIDFAYEIHSDIGNHCAGGKVDGKFMPIRTALANGQIIEVTTNKAASPKSDWLNFCLTSKARQHIRASLKQQSQATAIKLGEKILTKYLDSFKITLDQLQNEKSFPKYLKGKSLNSAQDFFQEVAYGNIEPAAAYRTIYGISQNESKIKAGIKKLFPSPLARHKNKQNSLDGIPTRVAQCCQPLQGDNVVGVISNSGLIKIHRKDCLNLNSLNPNQILNLNWNKEQLSDLAVEIVFEFSGGIEMLQKIASALKSLQCKILESKTENVTTTKATMRYTANIELHDDSLIDRIKSKLKRYDLRIYHKVDGLDINSAKI